MNYNFLEVNIIIYFFDFVILRIDIKLYIIIIIINEWNLYYGLNFLIYNRDFIFYNDVIFII